MNNLDVIKALKICQNIEPIDNGIQLSFDWKWFGSYGAAFKLDLHTMFDELGNLENKMIYIERKNYTIDCVYYKNEMLFVKLKNI